MHIVASMVSVSVVGQFSVGGNTYFLTLIDSVAAGRAYAAYGGVYIVASLLSLWAVERMRPDQWDAIGASVALLGASIIIFGPRG